MTTDRDRVARPAARARTVAILLGLLLPIGAVAALEAVLARMPAMAVAQAGERAFAPARELVLREYPPHARFAFAPPAIRREFPGDRPARDVYALETDADGFINPGRVHDRAALTIAFLGGSTTESMYVDPANRFPHRAARLLEAQAGVSVNGLNGGRSGNNGLHANLLLTAKVLPLRPDAVVLMEAVNDLGVLATYGSYWTGSRDFGPVRTPRVGIEPAVQRLRDAVIPYTWRAVRRATATLGRREAGVGGVAGAVTPPSEERVARWADEYESVLRQFVATARAWGVQPILMTQVRLAQTDGAGAFVPDAMAAAHAVFNDRMRAVAAAEGVALIDLAAARSWTRAELYDGLHFNDAGSLAAADIIAPALADILRRRAGPLVRERDS